MMLCTNDVNFLVLTRLNVDGYVSQQQSPYTATIQLYPLKPSMSNHSVSCIVFIFFLSYLNTIIPSRIIQNQSYMIVVHSLLQLRLTCLRAHCDNEVMVILLMLPPRDPHQPLCFECSIFSNLISDQSEHCILYS